MRLFLEPAYTKERLGEQNSNKSSDIISLQEGKLLSGMIRGMDNGADLRALDYSLDQVDAIFKEKKYLRFCIYKGRDISL